VGFGNSTEQTQWVIEKLDTGKKLYNLTQNAFVEFFSVSGETGKRCKKCVSVADIRADAARKRSQASEANFKFDPCEEVHLTWPFTVNKMNEIMGEPSWYQVHVEKKGKGVE